MLEGESTSNLDIFVFKVLPEVLEKQCGYKLFIHGRDDNVGEGMYVMEKVDALLFYFIIFALFLDQISL